MRQAPATDAAHPAAEPGEMLRPDRPVLLKSWWLKSLNHSVNHVPDKAMEDKWTSELAAHKTPPEPVAALWDKLTSGQASSALMPLAWKLRQNSASLSWTVPATGTVIHFDQLAMGSATDQPQLVLEWITFLTDAARQKMLLSATGYYPVQVPLGREIPDHTGPTPPWWNRSEFPVGQPAPEPEPVAPPAAVALPATAPATPTPAAPETSPPVVQDTPPPDTSPAPPPADQSPEITPTSPPPAQPAH